MRPVLTTSVETNDELSNAAIRGAGVGNAGTIVHGGVQLLKYVEGVFEVYRDNEDGALLASKARYSTAIVSDGSTIVAGGAKSVLVDEGEGFFEWPPLED